MERPRPDGPAVLRRRRLRQDRDRGARRVQGRAGGPAGGGARADHAAGRAAPSTFTERLAELPGRVAALSRFRTDARAAVGAATGIADGTVDVVIGTHRLLTAERPFKDLGLVVVDEEQRFGVEHKERLKQLRTRSTC